jgi:hypothetical protein
MPAPKGNQFALGNSGRSMQYNSACELENHINEYFNWCDDNPIIEQQWVGKEGTEVLKKKQRPYTIEGLGLHLGVTRQTLLNYTKLEGYEEFFDILLRARQRIVNNNITYGMTGDYNANIVKFSLVNNSEYKEKSETEIKGNLNTNIIGFQFTDKDTD